MQPNQSVSVSISTGSTNNPPEWNPAALMRSPFFVPLHLALANLNSDIFPTLQECNALLVASQPAIRVQSGLPMRFVPQESGKLPFERQYEPRCYLTGEVPTREHNWHDLFNALVWVTFPKAKAAINARHYHAMQNASSGSQRGAIRDINTLLDESGVIVPYADGELAGLLRDFKWKELFWQRREQVRAGMGFYIFGHGLYEKALHPYIGMTGQGLLLQVDPSFFDWPLDRRLAYLDTLLSQLLSDPHGCHDTRHLTPVPLLGVPGWTVDSENEAYYDNTAYFRPGRMSKKMTA